jgi:hypothetical protein
MLRGTKRRMKSARVAPREVSAILSVGGPRWEALPILHALFGAKKGWTKKGASSARTAGAERQALCGHRSFKPAARGHRPGVSAWAIARKFTFTLEAELRCAARRSDI